jgi:putative ABC transport system ATP-binding protein
MLQVTDLKKIFKSGDSHVAAVDGVSFKVPDGQFASIIGRSGSGKSTLLSLLGALDKPTSGSIQVGDQDITKLHDHALIRYRGRTIGFVFQNYNLVPNLTALENVVLPMEFAGMPRGQRVKRAEQLLTQVGLDAAKQQRKPGRLSGGEQQRVAIARALANKPQLILADEPTGNLDSQTGTKIFDLLHNLARTEHTTVLAVTHDLGIAGKTDVTFRLQDGKLIAVNAKQSVA